MERCPATTQKGGRCKNPAESCRYHTKEKAETPAAKTRKRVTPPSPSKTKPLSSTKSKRSTRVISKSKTLVVSSPTKKQVESSPPRKKGGIPSSALDKHFRGVSEKLCYDSLGFDCTLATKYRLDYRDEYMNLSPDDYRYGSKPYPKEFKIVAEHLMEICRVAIGGVCMVHPQMPGIQWTNNSNNFEVARDEFRALMHARGNHYSHEEKYKDNPAKTFKLNEDRFHCGCEVRPAESAANTLLFDPRGDDEKWEELHGMARISKESPYPERDFIKYDTKYWIYRRVPPALRQKIILDSIDYLGEEFKIHLMPKPEYQTSVLRELIKLLGTDKTFNANIEAWKAIIPYHQVIGELNLPSIVIYPVWGVKSAKIAISKILEHFSRFDADEIGMNHTPRFNHRHNALIYWANGSGDLKKLLPVSYFSSPARIFYKNHEIDFLQ